MTARDRGYAGYNFHLHSRRNGQTLGKLVTRTRLTARTGVPPSTTSLITRAAVYPGLAVLFGLMGLFGVFVGAVGFLIGLCTLIDGIFIVTDKPLRRALHDRISNTLVIRAD